MSDDKKRILVIEDSDIFADILISQFDSEKYITQRAVNGFEGIKLVYSFLPHLIITDIEMPLLKGYQATRLLKYRKNTKNIPIIMLTTLNETKDKFWADQTGADDYIIKSPDNFNPLFASIEKLISMSDNIDFSAIEKESKKITDTSIIEMINNHLDNKLFQSTVIGLLTELSNKVHSLELVVNGIFDLLKTICEAEFITLMICANNNTLLTYTDNIGGFTKEITDNFLEINKSDFNNIFNEFILSSKKTKIFLKSGTNTKPLTSYTYIPLSIAGELFATIHIANTINEYFSPNIMENLNIFMGASSPIIANALTMQELAELQKNTRIAFARYVPADVMDDIINGTAKKASVSENRNITVLFSDIRDFTTLSEHKDPQIVVDFLNNYFSKMGSEIISEYGHIDKFIGDAIMAVFGAIHNLENSPANAIKAAVKMLAAMEMINNAGSTLSDNNIEVGIGINCGSCILGNIGFKNKMDYTIIGDTVNLASRIQSITKNYHHPLLVSEYVYEITKENFLYRKVDTVKVKGKQQSVGIYAVYSGFYGQDGKKLRSGETADILSVPSLFINRETLINYNKGLQVFYIREWKLAQEYFSKALEADTNDFLSKLYLDRSKDYSINPPGENWDGVITLLEK
ncbi:MAG: adenylate/guanylate cyclase domain-containing response regulator [Treponema sp.]|nr:adenylate/guanylate cyclase domain-containing response regulator [Treponema sp.]MCL2252063.1 adenylate/guanylate cyclase domain-containing response regulator [Treponema sp.]